MSSRVVLIVPDAGPLISLGRAGALDLLLKIDIPVYVVDQVVHEVTKHKRFPDAAAAEKFVKENPGRVFEFETFVGKQAALAREAGNLGRQPGLGEASVAELFARLEEITGSDEAPALMLYEDSDIRKSRFVVPDNVHLLSTMGLLQGLEERGLISSAEEVWARILKTGRSPSDEIVDLPGQTSSGPTKW